MPTTPLEAFFPEVKVAGFTLMDGTVAFFNQVRALVTPEHTVLDFGAGRGAPVLEDRNPYRRRLACLRGDVARVIGVDVDPDVKTNPMLDEAHVIDPGGPLPLPDASVDLVVADWVLEHLDDPAAAGRELQRVLKPGGWICARTVHRWSYPAVASRLTPDRVRERLLFSVQHRRKAEDVFPVRYRANTRPALRHAFPPDAFEHVVVGWWPEPAYAGSSSVLWGADRLLRRVAPASLGGALFVFLRRR